MYKAYILLWGILLCASSFAQPINNEAIDRLGEELFDTSQHPEKSFTQYMEDLITLLRPVAQAESFCTKLEKLKNSQNGMLVGMTFLQHKKFFSDYIIRKAVSLGTAKLTEIFYKRTHPVKAIKN